MILRGKKFRSREWWRPLMSPQLLVAPGTGVPLLPFPYGPDYIKEPDYGTSPTTEL